MAYILAQSLVEALNSYRLGLYFLSIREARSFKNKFRLFAFGLGSKDLKLFEIIK